MNKSECYIGAVMLNPDVLIKFPVPYDAIEPKYQTLYTEIQKRVLAGEPVEPTDLHLAYKGKEWAEPSLLITMMNLAVIPQKARYYAEQLMKDYRKNKFKLWVESAKDMVDDGDVERAEAELIKLYEENYQAPYLALKDVPKQERGVLPRIHTGEPVLDNAWILDKGGLHIVAGRPAMGKTSFSLWIAEQAVRNNIPTLFISLEMPNAQVVNKLGLPDDAPFYISDAAAQTVEGILLKAQLAKRHKDIGLVVVDYLQLIRTKEKFNNREQQVSYIASTLKQMAKQLNIPVLACCQLNRMMEQTKDRRPQLSNLRESGSIEQDADSVVLMYRPEYYFKLDGDEVPEDQKGKCKIIIAKQRNAPTSELVCDWNPSLNDWRGWKEYEYKTNTGKLGQVTIPTGQRQGYGFNYGYSNSGSDN